MGFFRDLFNVDQTDAEYIQTHCPWAEQVQPKRRRRLRTMKPWGLCLHTTGRGVVKRARERGTTPIEEALKIYARSLGPHYAIGHDGMLYQLQADDRYGAHVGISAKERREYLNGDWHDWVRVTAENRARWEKRWRHERSPQHLYPTKSPNACYVGVEMTPLSVGDVGDVGDDGLWFTLSQHRAAALLGHNLAVRYGWPDQWWRSSRLVGHEDLDAFERWDKGGGWDPGALRDQPRFDWEYFKRYLRYLTK